MADNATKKLPAHLDPEKMFKPGQSGNPKGRPKGARNALGEAFIKALHDDFTEHGVAAIAKVRSEKPDQYVKVVASLLPKDVNLNIKDDMEAVSDEDLIARARELTDIVAPLLTGGIGDDTDGDPAPTAH